MPEPCHTVQLQEQGTNQQLVRMNQRRKEHYETESDDAPVEFEDPMYELMQEEEMEKEYEEMTPE